MKQTDFRFEPIAEDFVPFELGEIKQIESKVGVTLPNEYVDFASQYGGCGFSGDAIVHSEGGRYPIFTFFDFEKIIFTLNVHQDLTAEHMLAIADDNAGNFYLLDPATGSVFFVDFSVNPERATKVSQTFQAFLASIEVQPDD